VPGRPWMPSETVELQSFWKGACYRRRSTGQWTSALGDRIYKSGHRQGGICYHHSSRPEAGSFVSLTVARPVPSKNPR
jgi:hypothetical protein